MVFISVCYKSINILKCQLHCLFKILFVLTEKFNNAPHNWLLWLRKGFPWYDVFICWQNMQISIERQLHCLFNSLLCIIKKKTSALSFTDPFWWDLPVTGGFTSQRASNPTHDVTIVGRIFVYWLPRSVFPSISISPTEWSKGDLGLCLYSLFVLINLYAQQRPCHHQIGVYYFNICITLATHEECDTMSSVDFSKSREISKQPGIVLDLSDRSKILHVGQFSLYYYPILWFNWIFW